MATHPPFWLKGEWALGTRLFDSRGVRKLRREVIDEWIYFVNFAPFREQNIISERNYFIRECEPIQ